MIHLRKRVCETVRRDSEPSVATIDSQSIRSLFVAEGKATVLEKSLVTNAHVLVAIRVHLVNQQVVLELYSCWASLPVFATDVTSFRQKGYTGDPLCEWITDYL